MATRESVDISHSCTTPRLHPSIFRHHTASDKRGAKGIKHGKETRPRATVCSKTAVRVPTSHNREHSPRPGQPKRPGASSIFCLYSSLLSPASPGASTKHGAQQRSDKAGRKAERQAWTDKHRQPSMCMHLHGSIEEEEEEEGEEEEEKRKEPSATSGRVRRGSADERAQGAPCANASGQSTTMTCRGKGGRCCSSHWYSSLPKTSTCC
jgi:hypothetical protein